GCVPRFIRGCRADPSEPRWGALMSALPRSIGALLALLAYILPGLTLVRREEWTRAEPVELAAIACAGSVAWWSVGLWFLGWLRLPLSIFAVGSLVAALLVLVLLRQQAVAAAFAAWRASPTPALWSLVFLGAVFGTRAIFAFTRLACSV